MFHERHPLGAPAWQTMATPVTNTIEAEALPASHVSVRAFLVAWAVFWLLLATVSAQEYLRRGFTGIWPPLLWEGSSCLVASAIAWLLWNRLPRQDHLLGNAWRWLGASLVWLPPSALSFVATVYALRHAVYALAGAQYQHEPWTQVFAYETAKFSLFYVLFVAVLFGLRSHAAMLGERLRSLTQQAQVLQLTQQLEPHFLFNALNTIAATIPTEPALADTSGLMRFRFRFRKADRGLALAGRRGRGTASAPSPPPCGLLPKLR